MGKGRNFVREAAPRPPPEHEPATCAPERARRAATTRAATTLLDAKDYKPLGSCLVSRASGHIGQRAQLRGPSIRGSAALAVRGGFHHPTGSLQRAGVGHAGASPALSCRKARPGRFNSRASAVVGASGALSPRQSPTGSLSHPCIDGAWGLRWFPARPSPTGALKHPRVARVGKLAALCRRQTGPGRSLAAVHGPRRGLRRSPAKKLGRTAPPPGIVAGAGGPSGPLSEARVGRGPLESLLTERAQGKPG